MIYMLTPNTLSDLLISPSFVSLCPHISPTNQSTVSAHLTSCPPIRARNYFPVKLKSVEERGESLPVRGGWRERGGDLQSNHGQVEMRERNQF